MPDADAGSIHAIVWAVALDAMHDRAIPDRESARAHIDRFVLPALGLTEA